MIYGEGTTASDRMPLSEAAAVASHSMSPPLTFELTYSTGAFSACTGQCRSPVDLIFPGGGPQQGARAA